MSDDNPRLPKELRVAGWVLLPTFVFIHAFVWAENSGREVVHYLEGPLSWLFVPVSAIGFLGTPVWLLGATVSFLIALYKRRVPALADLALFAALGTLNTVYWYWAWQD